MQILKLQSVFFPKLHRRASFRDKISRLKRERFLSKNEIAPLEMQLVKFVLPAGVCAGLLVVTFGDVSCFGFGFFAVQCASRFWVGFSTSVLGIHPCFGPVTI